MSLDYKKIGKNIQLKRRALGITQERMAEELDFSVGFISQLERGITKMSLDSLYDITAFLDCSIADIVETPFTDDFAYSQTEFNSLYETLSPADQRMFFYMLEVYVKKRSDNP